MTTLRSPAQWLLEAFGATRKTKVTSETIQGLAAVRYSVDKISGHVGQLPLNVHRRLDRGSEKDRGHPSWNLLRFQPNSYQDPCVFKSTEMARALLWGNSRSFILRRGNRPVELIPLRPDATITYMFEGRKYHTTKPDKDDNLTIQESIELDKDKCVTLADEDVLHIQGFGDGIVGKSIAEVARCTLGIGLAGDNRASSQIDKGFTGRVIFNAPPGAMRKQEDADQFLKHVKKSLTAEQDGDEVAMLREGITAQVLAMNNNDAQFLESRQFQREDIAQLFGIESMPGMESSVSYNSLEQKQLSYLSGCLMGWLVKWEEQCNTKLLTPAQRKTHYHKFNVASLLRADTKSTHEALAIAVQNRWLSPNEAREMTERNPVDGLDTYENPNITPGPTEPQPAEETTEEAISAHMRHLLGVEAKRVEHLLATGRGKDIPAFYEKWETTFGNAIATLGGCRSIATDHVTRQLTDPSYELDQIAQFIARQIKP